MVLMLDLAQKEFDGLEIIIQESFKGLFRKYEKGEKLHRSKFKKLSGHRNLYEFRVKRLGNIYRCLGGMIIKDLIIDVVFQKKTQKMPIQYINLSLKRLRIYEK